MARARHEPVLLRQVLDFLWRGPGLYLDATVGDGGHAEGLLASHSGSRLVATDADPGSLAAAGERLSRFGERVMLIHARFSEIPAELRGRGVEGLRGALLDLGLSSRQLDDPARGLSFQLDGPLDLRLDPSRGATAAVRLAGCDARELAEVLAREGDVPRPHALARALVAARDRGRLGRTSDVVGAVERTFGRSPRPRLLAQVFQALRRWVNAEREELEGLLHYLERAIEPGGALVALTYHSGEDRQVKRFLMPVPAGRREARLPLPAPRRPWEPLARRAVVPPAEEVARNPRARSARLRAAVRGSA